ncbi:Nucleoside-diphosphate-sugar epimerase [Halalkaliarchaeum sp. AArc-CO]|uniref:NAD-dependent epimerase/dehydratase family protein n=1 Tax=unclassified Halalkaliarchaeum TaxID=2678344 RepID=UPI00217E1948|nr:MULTISPECIES: NAD(P)-dependent oxidoreductase [unclassified Halalkaliarchaeum]MDR5672230.1 NAD(P)-dependent oxidoreductase [Halalkaliarchaeum sp. AArc-GB]UWG50161.1 Nucleoside-diphosphate-sugar epimerase [Halalkaliarchaeum sp. AArc-CO]
MQNWNSENVLITGGLGFTGSNLASQLVNQGANVTLLDIVRSEEKLHSIRHIRDEVRVIDSDIRDGEIVDNAVTETDVVFHLASKTSRSEANENPRENLEINCRGPLNVLESAASCEDPPHVIYASSLAVVGNVSETIDESTVPNPVDMYGINKGAVEEYCKLYTRIKDVPTTAVRPANLYGPHAPLYATGYGIINQFVGAALRDETLPVFEPSDTREFLYIDDMVDALTRIAGDQTAFGECYVLSTGRSLTMKRAAEMVVDIAGSGSIDLVPWTDSWQEIRRGDVSTDPSKIESELGWTTNVSLEEGLERTFEFYRENDRYL